MYSEHLIPKVSSQRFSFIKLSSCFLLLSLIITSSCHGFRYSDSGGISRTTVKRLGNNPWKFESNLERFPNPCAKLVRIVRNIQVLIKVGKRSEKLYHLYSYWKRRLQKCEMKKNWNRLLRKRIGRQDVEKTPGSQFDTTFKTFVGLSGFSGILLIAPLFWLSYMSKQGKVMKNQRRKPMTQILHIHPPDSDEESGEKEKESHEESDKKKAAVGLGLAREILAINAESVHLAAHTIEFGFIMSKIARALAERGQMPSPPAPREGEVYTPSQALEFLSYLQRNKETSGILNRVCKEVKNPLGSLLPGAADFSGGKFCENVLKNAQKHLGLSEVGKVRRTTTTVKPSQNIRTKKKESPKSSGTKVKLL